MEQSALKSILENGLLGAFVVILMIVVWYLYKELQTSKDNRLSDLRMQNQDGDKVILETRNFMQRILDILQKGKEDV